MFFNRDIETMKRSDLEALQLERLRHLVRYCGENVEFYHKRFKEHNITEDKIKSLRDIEYIPFTTKEDVRDNYPFGLFAAKKRDIIRIHASSGTTGKPTVVGYTRNDISNWSDCVARLCMAAGATADDTVHISFGYGLFTGALGLHYGLEKLGAAVVPFSSGNTEKQIMLIKDFEATALVSTPSYAIHIGEVMRDLGVRKDDLKLRLGLFGSEGCTPEMREKIEESLGLFVTDNYGMSELMGPGVAGDCTERLGMHFAEDHFLPEIINSQTGEVLPRGETGELVVTTLTKEGIPLLRYRTKDITRINYDPCPCGRTHARMDKVKGRSDDMFKIRGVNIFPSQVESVIITVPELGPHYQLILTRENFVDKLEIRVELIDGSVLDRFGLLEELELRIKSKVKSVLGIDCKISIVPPRSIERTAGKAKRVIDLRESK